MSQVPNRKTGDISDYLPFIQFVEMLAVCFWLEIFFSSAVINADEKLDCIKKQTEQ